jgi:uncharacterized protein
MALYYGLGHTAHGQGEETGEGVVMLAADEEAIALDEEVRQLILLDVPLKHLCREDCRGICPGCGVDLNAAECTCTKAEIDPRWAKLSEVFRGNIDN